MTFLKTSGLYCVQLFIQTATQKERIVVASNVFVYTKTLFALQNACWGSAPNPFDLHFPMQAARPGGTLFTR